MFASVQPKENTCRSLQRAVGVPSSQENPEKYGNLRNPAVVVYPSTQIAGFLRFPYFSGFSWEGGAPTARWRLPKVFSPGWTLGNIPETRFPGRMPTPDPYSSNVNSLGFAILGHLSGNPVFCYLHRVHS